MSDKLEAAREIAAKWRELSKQIVIDIPAQAAIILDDRITELEKCREDIADWKDKAEKWQKQAISSTKNKLHYQGRAIKAEDEVKRLKAILAIGHFVIRD